jgi:hypothetical protein
MSAFAGCGHVVAHVLGTNGPNSEVVVSITSFSAAGC